MKTSVSPQAGRLLWGTLVCAILAPALLRGQSAQIQYVTIEKNHFYVQTDAGTLVDDPSGPWRFKVDVTGTDLAGLTAPVFTTPAGSTTAGATLQYDAGGGEWSWQPSNYGSQADLDAAFNDGTYVVTVQGTPISLGISGNAYPNPPQITASGGTWSGGVLTVDPTQDLTLTSNVFTGYNLDVVGHIEVRVQRATDNTTIAQADTISSSSPGQNFESVTIPANTMAPGETYTVQVGFDQAVSSQTLEGSDFGGYASVTTLTIQAQSSHSGPSGAVVGKFHYFHQSTANNVSEDFTRGGQWQFIVRMDGAAGDTDSKTVTPPGGTPQGLVYVANDQEWEYPVGSGGSIPSYSSRSSLNAAAPNGTYQLTVAGGSATTSLSGDTYPNAPVVHVSQGQWSGNQLVVDSTQALDLTINYTTNFVAGHAHSSIEFQSSSEDPYSQHADTGTADLGENQLTMTIPANALESGAVHPVLLHLDYVTQLDTSSIPDHVVAAFYESMTAFSVYAVDGGLAAVPVIGTQPASVAIDAGGAANFSVAATASVPLAYQWQRNGTDLVGANAATVQIANVQPADTGLYVANVTGGSLTASAPAILGILTAEPVLGDGTVLATNIVHPNGNHFDQVLVTGPAESVTADYADNRITRTSFLDLAGDIVQVEFAGHGTLSLVLDQSSGPALPANYNQNVDYMSGRAGLVIAGADETTNLSVFTVGRATAFDPTGQYNILLAPSTTNVPANNGSSLFVGHADTPYHGIAEISYVAIQSTDGKFGGLRTADAHYSATQGYTGVYAPGVAFQGPLFIGNIDAQGSATPAIIVGSVSVTDARITGGNLAQDNGSPVQVSGLVLLTFTDGSDSSGNLLPAQNDQGRLVQDGVDVTTTIVVNPGN